MKILLIAAVICAAGTAYGASPYTASDEVEAHIRATAAAQAAETEMRWLETKQLRSDERTNGRIEELERRLQELEDQRR